VATITKQLSSSLQSGNASGHSIRPNGNPSSSRNLVARRNALARIALRCTALIIGILIIVGVAAFSIVYLSTKTARKYSGEITIGAAIIAFLLVPESTTSKEFYSAGCSGRTGTVSDSCV
jgi:hypothetical protein